MRGPLTLLPQQYLPSILITPSLAFTGLTECLHVSPSPICKLLPCYTTWQIDECSCDSLKPSNRHKNTSMVAHTQTRITRSHWVTKLISATLLYVCIAIYWPLSARTGSKDTLKMTGMLLAQMLVVRVCCSNTHPLLQTSAGFQAQWCSPKGSVFHHKPDTPISREKWTCIISLQPWSRDIPPKRQRDTLLVQ